MKYLLDTCVISEFVKPAPNMNVLLWFETVQSDQLYISVLSIGELREGIYRLPKSKKKQKLSFWLESILSEYDDRILPITLHIAENWGIVHGKACQKGKTLPAIDGLIAATALTSNMVLVTRNVKDFKAVSVELLNPWDSLN